jgi:diguanylate cyclase (GGDEF)-like protein
MLSPAIPEDEKQRVGSLRALNVLFTPAEERFDRITRLASRLLDVPIAVVSLVAEDRQWFKSTHGLAATETSREASFCGHAILGKNAFVIENALLDSRFADNPLVTNEPHIRAYAGHPLCSETGSRIGTLCVIDAKPRTFTSEQLEVLQDLAALVETELERSQLSETRRDLLQQKDDLTRKAMTDTLTRTWNRGAIEELLALQLAKARRGTQLCITMIDVDQFKRVNDNYGHQAGDEVLVEVAARMRRAAREVDILGRYGGEEFLMILTDCDLDNAKTVAERTRSEVATKPIVTAAGSLSVTISVGIAAYDSAHSDATSLIKAADAFLYLAKRNGRNRVECQTVRSGNIGHEHLELAV